MSMSDAFNGIANPYRGNARGDVQGIYAYAMPSYHHMEFSTQLISKPLR
jgi:hypothetical protein